MIVDVLTIDSYRELDNALDAYKTIDAWVSNTVMYSLRSRARVNIVNCIRRQLYIRRT